MPIYDTQDEVVFTGYSMKSARELLGLKKETMHYWRKNLDPVPKRTRFMPKDILVYRIMKMFIGKRRVSVKELSNYDWTETFNACEKFSYKKLKKYIAVLNNSDKTLKLIGPGVKVDALDLDITTVQLSTFIDDHINQFANPKVTTTESNVIKLDSIV